MDLTLFAAVKKRLNWLGQRQEILAQNISNADTPDYKAKDLKPYAFRDLLRKESAQLNMVTTEPGQLGGRRKRIRDFFVEEPRHPYETAPNGNSVVLEEQMGKVAETQTTHRLTTELYKKHMEMLKTASRGR
ncbi:MAG: flagellar basal body rod protein FlgB [Alphaproteobacteria bacterium]|jgi:flagellar basal-body rod protein FlgB|nr:flagellar basal body rod protein FlgB [Magnetovibrio sp.]MCF3630670.1 flagellar basal body rod protein FlgB [Alphaproteobacteria bacterium LMO-S08]WND75019.1 flagellar basal body rod protein FlgB [Thalassospiraceae bacterium LMO-SO8]HBT42105.1 flagellar basal body rod protein FlgB [Rhodospirillaceae bacterium]HCS70771.1 flagellar basal body rod protein FlgB [Rhodospirillaceae bacterium]|tara:strand:+ start:673 stop:1068 length:396 start_codon:yes stop_codon:yes gene_type:complete